MRAINDFIVTPSGGRYNNTVKVGDKELVTNTEMFSHQHVNREAIIIATPSSRQTEYQVGDIVIVHHNLFRRWQDIRGDEQNSRGYFKEGQYFCKEDQMFLYKRKNEWIAPKGCCFVKPIKSVGKFETEKERPLIGVIKYVDKELGKVGIQKGDLVGFTPWSEYEFVIDGERMYRVYTNDISIKYEYKGDEEEYNPSWAESSH